MAVTEHRPEWGRPDGAAAEPPRSAVRAMSRGEAGLVHRLGWVCGCVTSLWRHRDRTYRRRVTPCGTAGCALRSAGEDGDGGGGVRVPAGPRPAPPALAAEAAL